MALLTVRNLDVTVRTGTFAAKVLEGVSFEVKAGEVLGIVGESGSGKSMTALAIQRLLPDAAKMSAGEVIFDGTDLSRLSEEAMRRLRGPALAQIFQDPLSSLNPVFTVGSHIGEGLGIHLGMGRREARRRTLELLDLVGLQDVERRIHQFPHELSGGMRQRVMIAMALSCNPMLLIADEPTTALDVTVQAQILRLLRRLQRQLGMAIIFITHDLGVVAQFADRLAVMYGGRIVEEGPVRDVIDRPSHPYSEALLKSIPALNFDTGRLPMIAGSVPPIGQLPSGCHFRTRCTFEMAPCADMPADFMVRVPPAQSSACIRHTGYSHDAG